MKNHSTNRGLGQLFEGTKDFPASSFPGCKFSIQKKMGKITGQG